MSHAAEALRDLQQALEALYRLDPAPCVTDFVVDGRPPRREELLLVEEDDLYVALALDPAVPRRLLEPRLAPHNLQEFCLAVEGVSHFLFLSYCARQARHTSLLELELVAEVDKWVACLILARRAPTLPAEELRQALYESFALAEGLDRAAERRYLRANGLARRYTGCLEQRYVRRLRLAAMLVELRQFYRMGGAHKQEHIDGR